MHKPRVQDEKKTIRSESPLQYLGRHLEHVHFQGAPGQWFSVYGAVFSIFVFFIFLKILFILDRGEGREKERERNINVWLLLVCPQLGTRPATQACTLTGN